MASLEHMDLTLRSPANQEQTNQKTIPRENEQQFRIVTFLNNIVGSLEAILLLQGRKK